MLPPTSAAEPREALLWARRAEVVSGLAGVALGAALWNAGWWHWIVLGCGLLGLSPWPGPGAILRRAERKPEILISDPARRRARARRALLILVPAYTAASVVAGLIAGGVGAAIVIGALIGASSLLGAWLVLRRG